MAIKDRVIEIAYKLKDQFTAGTKKIAGSLRKVETASDKSTDKMVRNNKRASSSFGGISRAVGPVKLAILGLGAAIAGIIASIGKWTKAAATQERAETKLATSLKSLAGATDDQVKALYDQAAALQQVTGYGDEATISAQAMLATFKLNASQIQQLTPLLLDTAEAQRKMGNESVDLESIAIALGKAFTSGIGSLSRYGIALTDAQKEAFKLADQQGKVNLLVQALTENYGGLAEAVGKQYDGSIRGADAAQGDFLETLGRVFTQNKAWIKLVQEVKAVWESLAEGIAGSGKEIGHAVTRIAQGLTTLIGGIRITFNTAQIVIKSAAVAVAESVQFILRALSKVSFGALSKRLKKDADDIKRYARELREGITDDFGDIEEASNSIIGAWSDMDDAAEDVKKSTDELTKSTKDLGKKTNDTKKSIKQEKDEIIKHNTALEAAKKKVDEYKKAKEKANDVRLEFEDFVEGLGGGGGQDDPPDYIDASYERLKAQNALDTGNYDEAIEKARSAADMVKQIGESGEYSNYEVTNLGKTIRNVAVEAANRKAETSLIDGEKEKTEIEQVKELLSNVPANIDQASLSQSFREALQTLQAEASQNPVVVKVQTVQETTHNGVRGYSDGTDYIETESRKRGIRPQ
jgi:hypothetical protein